MLQIARLAPNLLHEASEKVVEFLLGQLNEDGGGKNRAGESDLYYTAFLLDSLIALQAELPVERVASYLRGFGDGSSLDLVHGACLVRCWAAVTASAGSSRPPGGETGEAVAPGEEFFSRALQHVESYRTRDGGYSSVLGSEEGTVYGAFLALGAYQDVRREPPAPERLAECVEARRSRDGGYGDGPGMNLGTTPTTAAASTLLCQLGREVPAEVGPWILARAYLKGGFLAVDQAPIPDLLSTATALHSLAALGISVEGIKERTLDFIDTLWTGRAFCGHWDDDEVDCEYAFYALLALGHLSL